MPHIWIRLSTVADAPQRGAQEPSAGKGKRRGEVERAVREVGGKDGKVHAYLKGAADEYALVFVPPGKRKQLEDRLPSSGFSEDLEEV